VSLGPVFKTLLDSVLLLAAAAWFRAASARRDEQSAVAWALAGWALAPVFLEAVRTDFSRALTLAIAVPMVVMASSALGLAIPNILRGIGLPHSMIASALGCGLLVTALSPLLPRRDPTAAKTPPPSREVLRFQKHNLRFRPPGEPWVELDTKAFDPGSLLAFMRSDPSVFFSLTAETDDTATEAFAEAAKGDLKSKARSFRLIDERPYAVNGLTGIRLVAESDKGSGAFVRVVWVLSLNGYAYRLQAWGAASKVSPKIIEDEAAQILTGFDILDRQRVASPGESDAAEDFRSTLYGYEVLPGQKGWNEWREVSTDVPGAEFGLVADDDAAVVIVPVSLLGQNPDLGILAQALAESLEIDGLSPCRALAVGELAGCDFDYQRSLEGTPYLYRLKVLKGRGLGYLIASWIPKRVPPARRGVIEDALSLVRFSSQREKPPSPEDLRPAQKSFHSRIFNEMGLASYAKERYGDAVAYFRIAFELEEVDPALLENVVEAYTALGRYRDALSYLDGHAQGFPHEGDLQEWRDFLKDQLDQEKDGPLLNKSA
jgi:hypothetical protein